MNLHELATKHGQIAPPVDGGSPYLVGHRLAALLHGWTQHEYHYGAIELSDEDYLAAIAAAADGHGVHAPAVPVVSK